jgi:2-keto-4-pentenoate hydratase/2-oxohepta-3-ene-1,7-dioic acid hydratase in catechol pathway
VRLATIAYREGTSAALVADGQAAPLRELPGRRDAVDVLALIDAPLTGPEIEALRRRSRPLTECTLLPPVPRPPKNVLCVGKNYHEHVVEGARAAGIAAQVPTVPVWFTKAHTALIGCGAPIPHDPAFTAELDYEGEVALVIGQGGRDIPREHALSHVFGYTLFNDVTARDRQQLHNQWFVGKSADGFAPCGPWLVTADEFPAVPDICLRTTVDGALRQSDRTTSMIFDIPTLITSISQSMRLQRGDLIATGTPSGVAWGAGTDNYLRHGQTVAVESPSIGRLWNPVLAVANETGI